MSTPLKISRSDVNWDDTVEKALENHLDHLRAHHQQVWPTIIDQDINFFDTAPPLLTPPSPSASEHEWHKYDSATEEMFYDWNDEQLRVDHEIPYFHLTSLFVHICSSIEGWLSSLCDLLAGYHHSRLTRRDIKSDWALSAHLRFLESTLYLDLAVTPKLMQQIRERYSVRNAIVHAPPLFHFSPVWRRDEYPRQSHLTCIGAFTASRDGNLRFNEDYLLQSFDDGITFSQIIANAI